MIESYNSVQHAMKYIGKEYQLGTVDMNLKVKHIFPEYCEHVVSENDILFKLNGVELPGRWTNEFCEKMIKQSNQSHFGDLKSCETTLDETVRNSYEITQGIEFTELGESVIEEFCAATSRCLYGRNVGAKIDKLLIYPVGGFFKRHQDTPKPDCVGTIICNFPGNYSGGELTIGNTEIISSSDDYTFYSFYGNTPHSIDKVYKNYRVSVTLSLFYIDNYAVEMEYIDDYMFDDDDDATCECPFEIIREPYFSVEIYFKKIMKFLEVGPLGLILHYDYSNDEIVKRDFKRNDFALWNFIQQENLDYDIVPVLIRYEGKGRGTDVHRKCSVFSFRDQDIESINDGDEDSPDIVKKYKNVRFIGLMTNVIKTEHVQEVEYTGNECQEEEIDNFYYQVAIICNKLNQ